MTHLTKENVEKAKKYLAQLFGVDVADVHPTVAERKRDKAGSTSLLPEQELYYTEASFEVRIPGPGLVRERAEAAARAKAELEGVKAESGEPGA